MIGSLRRTGMSVFRAAAVAAFLAGLLGLWGCGDENDPFNVVEEDELAPPLGLQSITGDEEVTLVWFTSNFESDFEGYFVFLSEESLATHQSTEIDPSFFPVDTLELNSSGTVRSVRVRNLNNGQTYSFAVAAFRDGGDEISRLSNIVSDTPRPDIESITLTSSTTGDLEEPIAEDATAGFDFDDFDITPVPVINDYDDGTGTDIVHEAFDPGPDPPDNIRSWIAGMNGGDVQDMGFMADLDSADVAPPEGYAGPGESVLLAVGHVYAVRTGTNHFAKFIVTDIDDSVHEVTFNAAFQTKRGDANFKRELGID